MSRFGPLARPDVHGLRRLVPGGSSGGGWRHYRIRLADFLSQSGTITIPAAYSFSKLILFNDDDGTGSGNSVSRFRNVLLYEGASPLGDVLASDVLYTYDAAGHRVARGESSPNTLPPQTEYFVYDGSQLTMTFAGSTGGSPVLAHRYLYGPAGQVLVDEVFETVGGQRVSDEVLWLLADHQGTVRDVVDSDGVLRKHVEYDAFGRITQEEFYAENGSPISAGHAEAVDQLFYYTGQDRDATTDLQLHGARWYDPATARWLSEDPIAFDGGDPNLYRYAGNSAPNFTDPTGLSQAGNPLKSLASVSKPFTNVNYAAPSPQATLSQADQYFANQRSSRSVYDPLYVAPSFTGPKRSTAPLPTDSQILSNYFNDPRYQAIQRAEDDAYTVQTAQYLIQQGSVGQATVAQLVLTGHELYGGFVPGVGEFQDAEAFLGRSSTLTERSVAGASLGLNLLTAGAAPNFGGAGRVLRTETHYLDEVLDAQRFTHQIDVGSFDNAIISQYDTLAPTTVPSGGRLGSASTRQHVGEVTAELRSRGYEVTGGGGVRAEEYIPGAAGRKGSAYPDITATKNGRTLRINTVDTLTDAVTPTAREAANAAKIRQLKPNEHLLLVPKPKR